MIHPKPLLEPEFHLKMQELSTITSNQEIRLKIDHATQTHELVAREFGPIAGLKEAAYALGHFFQMEEVTSEEIRLSSDAAAYLMDVFLEMHKKFINNDNFTALAKLSCYFKSLESSNEIVQKTVEKIRTLIEAKNRLFVIPFDIFNHILSFLPQSQYNQALLALRGSCNLLRDKFPLESLLLSDAFRDVPKAVRSFGRMLVTLLQNGQTELAGNFFSKFFKESSLFAKERFLRFFFNGGRLEQLHELLDLKGSEIEALSFIECKLLAKGEATEKAFPKSPSTLGEILKIIKKCPNTKILHLSSIFILHFSSIYIESPEEESSLNEIISRLKSLQQLKLGITRRLEIDHVYRKANVLKLPSPSQLHSLKLRYHCLPTPITSLQNLEELIIPHTKISNHELVQLLSSNRLKALKIEDVTEPLEESQVPFVDLSRLTYCSFEPESNHFLSYLKHCKNLEILKIKNIHINPQRWHPFFSNLLDELPEFPKLKQLFLDYFSSNTNLEWLKKIASKYTSSLIDLHTKNKLLITTNQMDEAIDYLLQFQNLRSMKITMHNTPLDLTPFLTALLSLPNLETLELDLVDNILSSFPKATAKSRLRHLCLEATRVSSETFADIATYQTLESIKLTTQCTDEEAHMVSRLKNLKKCSLTNKLEAGGMTNAGLSLLAKLSFLRELTLNEFPLITSAGFVELFQKIPDLESLSFSRCPNLRINNDEIAPEFINILSQLKNLSYLNVSKDFFCIIPYNPKLMSEIGEDLF